MTSITVQLTPETEQRLRLRASERGESLESLLSELAEKEAKEDKDDLLSQGVDWLARRSEDDVRISRERILGTSPSPQEIPAGKTVVDMVEGKWPGNETDAEVQEALARIS